MPALLFEGMAMTKIEIDDMGRLSCPSCKENELHHYMVTIYGRTEDAPHTQVIEIADRGILERCMDSDECGNPSLRRDGVAVRFWCEHCDVISEMTIAQHKGLTLLDWRM